MITVSKKERALYKTITVALAGNPNSGKTTIFNNLTGSHQRVGNFPGVTVESKEGYLRHDLYRIKVVDLPGTYSLSAYSLEEIVARNFIIHQRPDVVVDIIDGGNLERNLYLGVQLKELNVPLVIALNMADEMKQKGIHVDCAAFSRFMGAAVVPTVATRGKGTDKLVEAIIQAAEGHAARQEAPRVDYGPEIENELAKISALIEEQKSLTADMPGAISSRWLALKLLEKDAAVTAKLQGPAPLLPGSTTTNTALQEQLQLSLKHLMDIFNEEPDTIITEQRYGHVQGMYRKMVSQKRMSRINISDQIDKVLTNRLLGLPIFAVLMYVTFWLVFTLGERPMQGIEIGQAWLAHRITLLWPAGSESLLKSLLVDGVIAGVGGVLVFLPNIVLLFLALSLLEDTGYMARAAFIMDRLMKWVGLHGKSFIPMLLGFGCSVPAIMATRVLDNRRDRLTTMLVLPLISCGARFPIYMLIIPAFFPPSQRAPIMYAIYIIGVVLAVICAKLLRSLLFRGELAPFIMELPPYRLPTTRAVLIHMGQRSWLYLRKAGTIILAVSIIMWAVTTFPRLSAQETAGLTADQARQMQLTSSWAGRLGQAMEPALKLMGFDWKIGTALIGTLVAKEVFVAQMGIVYSLGEVEVATPAKDSEKVNSTAQQTDSAGYSATEHLRTQLRKNYSPLVGLCIMLFCLIASPCAATLAVIRRESGSWWWAALQSLGLTLIGFVLTTIVYQIGHFLQIGTKIM